MKRYAKSLKEYKNIQFDEKKIIASAKRLKYKRKLPTSVALEEETVIPIPVGPLKCAILAVCQEYVGDDERAMLNWQKFDNFITRSERQTHGPKKMFMGFDSSLRRKPTQFM
jgi:hypothetical protein